MLHSSVFLHYYKEINKNLFIVKKKPIIKIITEAITQDDCKQKFQNRT
jgi:hypothetical protein